MTPEEIRLIIDAVAAGRSPLPADLAQASAAGYVDVGPAKVDVDRERRRGAPEVIYCPGKSPEQIALIARTLVASAGLAFGTRCDPEQARRTLEILPGGHYDAVSRILRYGTPRPAFTDVRTAVIAAGTSDLGVAEEACGTLDIFGAPVVRVFDVGVAGLHRLLGTREQIEEADVLIVVAGMEGALPSVVGGLFRQPIIAVPTSVGYGTSLSGFTPLFAMLTSCASGITVVNIDNGFGAAMAALSIVRAIERARQTVRTERSDASNT